MEQYKIKISPEQAEQIRKSIDLLIDSFTTLWDELQKTVKAFMDIVRETFTRIMRMLTLQQLVEWRLPYRMAEYLSSKMPEWLAFRIGLHYFYSNVPALE